jgi:hypothetical protein
VASLSRQLSIPRLRFLRVTFFAFLNVAHKSSRGSVCVVVVGGQLGALEGAVLDQQLCRVGLGGFVQGRFL